MGKQLWQFIFYHGEIRVEAVNTGISPYFKKKKKQTTNQAAREKKKGFSIPLS